MISLKTNADSGSLSSALRMTILLEMIRIDALHRRLVQRAGQIIDNRVEQRLHTLVLECASADNREDLQIDGGLANAGLQLGNRRRLAFEKLLQQHIVGLGDHFDQLQTERFRLLLQVGGNRLDIDTSAPIVSSCHRIAFISIRSTTPLKSASAPIGNLQRDRPCAQPLADGVQNVLEVRAVLVHLVHEADARNLVLVALPPDGLGLRLHARNRIEHRHRAVETRAANAPPRR